MSLPLYDDKQDESLRFSKICFIPSLKLSCFGCCGHHFADKETLQKFFDENKRELKKYLEEGKSYSDFMNREHMLDSCGACYSLIQEKQPEGHQAYVCAVHPLRVGGEDVRPGYCDFDYLCYSAALVNKMTDEEKALFYEFLKEKQFDAFEYSIINGQEKILIKMYWEWKEERAKKLKSKEK